jgi:hypothetical protein
MIRRTSDNRPNGDHARAIRTALKAAPFTPMPCCRVCPVAVGLGGVVAKKSDRSRDPGLAAVAA